MDVARAGAELRQAMWRFDQADGAGDSTVLCAEDARIAVLEAAIEGTVAADLDDLKAQADYLVVVAGRSGGILSVDFAHRLRAGIERCRFAATSTSVLSA
ncbi:MAG: hypothetical protein GC191_08040 [Azospirillum sp.]|nr:hypothetical protein [Azospirillum sp.]